MNHNFMCHHAQVDYELNLTLHIVPQLLTTQLLAVMPLSLVCNHVTVTIRLYCIVARIRKWLRQQNSFLLSFKIQIQFSSATATQSVLHRYISHLFDLNISVVDLFILLLFNWFGDGKHQSLIGSIYIGGTFRYLQHIALVFLTVSQNICINLNATRVLPLRKFRKRVITKLLTSKMRLQMRLWNAL